MAEEHPVVVIGAGPVGLAAAAELDQRGLPVLVLEKGAAAGSTVREWGHVRLFSMWRDLVDPAAEKLLAATDSAKELSHPEAGFYLAGMKSYGRAPTFLALTGFEQVRSIAAELAGDHASAARVELTLPDTGVCGGSGLFGDAERGAVAQGGEAAGDDGEAEGTEEVGCCGGGPEPVELPRPAASGLR